MSDTAAAEAHWKSELNSMLEQTFTRRVASTADRLRELADEIEREGGRIIEVSGRRQLTASVLASNIMHSLIWGLANASADAIVAAAAEYDRDYETKIVPPGAAPGADLSASTSRTVSIRDRETPT